MEEKLLIDQAFCERSDGWFVYKAYDARVKCDNGSVSAIRANDYISCDDTTLTGNPSKYYLRCHATRRIHPTTKCGVIACHIFITSFGKL